MRLSFPRCAGLVVGLGLVAVLVSGWTVAGGRAAPGAHVTVTVNRTGELDVAPLGRLLDVRDIVPGGRDEARFVVTNVTGSHLAVRVRARADSADLDDQLMIELSARGKQLFAGTLGKLRGPTRRRLLVAPAARAAFVVHVSLPAAMARAYRARGADVSLELLAG